MLNETVLTVIVTIVAIIVLRLVVALILAGGDVGRIRLAITVSLRLLRDPAFGQKVTTLIGPAEEEKPRVSGEPVRMLALLQRDGRLLDFLLEDIQAYSDDQVGAAVRDIHRQCQKAVKEHLVLEAVLPQQEGDTVEVPTGFDPSAIRVTGNVTGEPPFTGTLRHHGWRVKELKLSAPPPGQDHLVLQPAEVEV